MGFIIVLMYFLRITGRLSSDRPAKYKTKHKNKYGLNKTLNNSRDEERINPLPPWRQQLPLDPSFNLDKKLTRRKRDRKRSPSAALKQNYHSPLRRHRSKFIFRITY